MRFATAADWEAWLDEHHADHPDGVWLEIGRAGSGSKSITAPQALEVALCFGWIDGQRGKKDPDADPDYFRQRYLPRRTRSRWSKINRGHAERLVAEGRMRPAGLAEIERAKADGRWDAAYDPPSKATVPDDLRAALDAEPKAAEMFATLNSQNRYAILFRVHEAKRPETRARRIEKFVAMLARGETLH